MSFDLGRALEDLAEAGAARRSADDDVLSARVTTMTSRIRRRRALRHTGTTVVAACAVGALAVGVVYLPGLLGDEGPTGPAGPSATAPANPTVEPTTPTVLAPLTLTDTCGVSMSALEQTGQLSYFVETGESSTPQTADGGFTEILAVSEIVGGAETELRHTFPAGAHLQEISWTLLVTDADGVVIAFQQSPLAAAVAPEGVTSTEVNMTLPGSLCASPDALSATEYDLFAVAEAHGTLTSGSPYLERTVSEAFSVQVDHLVTKPRNPIEEVFACWQPPPESIHTLPDAGGLTLAVDIPEGPWDTRNEITGTIGTTDGQSIIANVSQGASFALVDESGEVVAFAQAHAPDDVVLVEVGPESTAPLTATTYLLGCGRDGVATAAGAEEGLEGTFTAWPFVTAVAKETVDAEGNVSTPSSDPVIVIANPQQVTFTKD